MSRKYPRGLGLLTFLLVLSLHAAHALQEWIDVFDLPTGYNRMDRPRKGSDPDTVAVSVIVTDLHVINEQERYVDFSLFVIERWTDSRLAAMEYRGRVEEGEIGYPLWTPNLVLLDQKWPIVITSRSLRLNPSLGIWGEVEFRWKAQAKVCREISSWAYPFDYQHLSLQFTSFAYSRKDVVFEVQENELVPEGTVDFAVLGGKITSNDAAAGDTRFEYEINLARKRTGAIITVIFPQYIIVMYCLMGLFIFDTHQVARLEHTSIGFLGMVEYAHVVQHQIPRVGWMLWVHWYTVMSMAFSLLAFFHCIFTYFALTEIAVHRKKIQTLGLVYMGEGVAEEERWCLSRKFVAIMNEDVCWAYPVFYTLSVIAMIIWVIVETEKDNHP